MIKRRAREHFVSGEPGAHVAVVRRGALTARADDIAERAVGWLHTRLDDLMGSLVPAGGRYHILADSVGWYYEQGADGTVYVQPDTKHGGAGRKHWESHLNFSTEATLLGMQLQYGETPLDAGCRWSHELRQRPLPPHHF